MDDFVARITDKSKDISQWYTDVILKAQLADYAPVRGCMVIRPYGYAIWENMQALLDRRFKATGHENAYFPLLIPESLFDKEAEHIQGFSPEVAWVTAAGGENLPERLAIRPTSETIAGTMYSKWIQSWRDLPILVNQWCNVLRWEKETRFFLRTTEFLWQEGHTVHRTEEEAEEETLRMLEIYRDFIENEMAIPVIPGRKTESEKFAGAVRTYSVEAMMPDGKALQAGTSHNLGQNFAKSFNITFLDIDGQRKHAWTTSWGASTRLMGALIMTHGDDAGLVLPPHIAPLQVVIVPIGFRESRDDAVSTMVDRVIKILDTQFRVKADWRVEHTPGWKFNEWELRGVPLRIEIGPREAAKDQILLVRRDNRARLVTPVSAMSEQVGAVLEDMQRGLFLQAQEFRDSHIFSANTFEELQRILIEQPGFVLAPWCGSSDCEQAIKAATTATIRSVPLEAPDEPGRCVYCGQAPTKRVYFAKSY